MAVSLRGGLGQQLLGLGFGAGDLKREPPGSG